MCDWEADGYAEYLLWVAAERARVRVRTSLPHESSPVKTSVSVEVRHEVAEA